MHAPTKRQEGARGRSLWAMSGVPAMHGFSWCLLDSRVPVGIHPTINAWGHFALASDCACRPAQSSGPSRSAWRNAPGGCGSDGWLASGCESWERGCGRARSGRCALAVGCMIIRAEHRRYVRGTHFIYRCATSGQQRNHCVIQWGMVMMMIISHYGAIEDHHQRYGSARQHQLTVGGVCGCCDFRPATHSSRARGCGTL